MTTLDLLGTSSAPKPRKLTQYVPWLIAFAAIIYVFRSIEEHPECIPTIPHPLSDATEQSSISSHLSYHNKGFGRWSSYESWFFFGDSYTATNFDENGEQPRPGHPLGNLGKDALRSMLQNWPLYVTSRYNASFIKSYKFAKGSSTVDRDQVKPYMLGSSFIEEAKVFIDNYVTPPRKTDWNPETSLFSMWFGVNDLVLPHWTGDDQGSMPAIFASYTETTVKLYNAGARNFIFLTVPPAYRSIELDAGGLLSVAEDMASFNSRIFEMRSNPDELSEGTLCGLRCSFILGSGGRESRRFCGDQKRQECDVCLLGYQG